MVLNEIFRGTRFPYRQIRLYAHCVIMAEYNARGFHILKPLPVRVVCDGSHLSKHLSREHEFADFAFLAIFSLRYHPPWRKLEKEYNNILMLFLSVLNAFLLSPSRRVCFHFMRVSVRACVRASLCTAKLRHRWHDTSTIRHAHSLGATDEHLTQSYHIGRL